MATESIKLPDQMAEFIRERVASGRYIDKNDVVLAGLRLLEEHEREHELKLDRLRKEIQLGLDDIENGRYVDLNNEEDLQAYSQALRRRVRETLAREDSDDAATSTQ